MPEVVSQLQPQTRQELQFQGEYLGAALQAFLRGLTMQDVATLILHPQGLEKIESTKWYDINTARTIYRTVAEKVGPYSLTSIGKQIMNTAELPPAIRDPRTALENIDATYRLNVRGERIGAVKCEFDSARSARLEFSTPFPCALARGIIMGCCEKFGARAVVEHGPGGCRDQGASSCTYRVSWR